MNFKSSVGLWWVFRRLGSAGQAGSEMSCERNILTCLLQCPPEGPVPHPTSYVVQCVSDGDMGWLNAMVKGC